MVEPDDYAPVVPPPSDFGDRPLKTKKGLKWFKTAGTSVSGFLRACRGAFTKRLDPNHNEEERPLKKQ